MVNYHLGFGTEDIRNSMKKTCNLKKKEGFALYTNPMGKRKKTFQPNKCKYWPYVQERREKFNLCSSLDLWA